MLISTDPGVWVSALCTLAVFSYLFKDNAFWKATEHIFVGFTAAYTVGQTFHTRIKPTIINQVLGEGRWSYIIPILLGLAIYMRFSPSLIWITRYPLSMWVGYGAGLTLAYSVPPLLTQVRGSFREMVTLNDWIYWAATVATLTYFIFTISRDKWGIGYSATAGRWVLMIALGASFGNTVLYRYNLLLARINYLFIDWLQIAG